MTDAVSSSLTVFTGFAQTLDSCNGPIHPLVRRSVRRMNPQLGQLEGGHASADLILYPEKHVIACPFVIPDAQAEVVVEGKLLVTCPSATD